MPNIRVRFQRFDHLQWTNEDLLRVHIDETWKSKKHRRSLSSINKDTREPEIRIAGVLQVSSIPQLDRSPTRVYSSIASTSATNRWLLSVRNPLITLNTASLKPPMFRISARSQA